MLFLRIGYLQLRCLMVMEDPKKIETEVSLKYKEQITAARRREDEKQLKSSLRMLGDNVLGPDAKRE